MVKGIGQLHNKAQKCTVSAALPPNSATKPALMTPEGHSREKTDLGSGVVMILPQVHLRKPCYDFTFL